MSAMPRPDFSPERVGDLSIRLARKAKYGGEVEGNLIGPDKLPKEYKKALAGASDQPLAGWDPKDLDPDEQKMLFQLMGAYQREQRGGGSVR